MVARVYPIPAGNALRVIVTTQNAAVSGWRVLRGASPTFSGPNDPNALVVFDGNESTFVDFSGLVNGTTYYYGVFYRSGGALSLVPEVVSCIPAYTIEDDSVDAQELVRDRLQAALAIDVAAGRLNNILGYIPVMTAPPVFEDTSWPVVVVHLQGEQNGEHGVGGDMVADFGAIGDEGNSYLASASLRIEGWTINPDQRIDLRKAIRRAVVANLEVFSSVGMQQVNLSFSDTEDFQSYNAPVYQTILSLSCLAPVRVTSPVGVIGSVSSSPLGA